MYSAPCMMEVFHESNHAASRSKRGTGCFRVKPDSRMSIELPHGAAELNWRSSS